MTTDMQAILQDAIEAIAESADEIKAGCAIGEHWPDAEDKAEYDRRIALLERLRALASRPDAQADERPKSSFDTLPDDYETGDY